MILEYPRPPPSSLSLYLPFFFFFFQVQKSPSNLLSGSIFTWETPQSLSHSNRETRGTQSQKEQEMPGVHVFLS